MLATLTAVEFVRPMDSGRTSPLLVNCQREDGTIVPVVVKLSDYCDQKETHLAREVVASCLAGDLGLPVPEPFLVEIPDGWSEVIDDPARKARVNASSPIAFGCRLMTPGYSVWTPSTRIGAAMLQIAASIFTFDAIIQNSDRRSNNPNCLTKGESILIIDHELAFAHRLLLGWRAPWTVGGLNWLTPKGAHIFFQELRHCDADFAIIEERWKTIVDSRLGAYKAALPAQWAHVAADADQALALIHDARENIGACMVEVQRVLS